MKVLTVIIIVFGLLALGYNLFDLMWPGHFVGDMYGLEVMIRLAGLAIAVFPMLLGFLYLIVRRRKGNDKWPVGGAILFTISSLILIVIAFYTFRNRELMILCGTVGLSDRGIGRHGWTSQPWHKKS